MSEHNEFRRYIEDDLLPRVEAQLGRELLPEERHLYSSLFMEGAARTLVRINEVFSLPVDQQENAADSLWGALNEYVSDMHLDTMNMEGSA